jgi:SPP1 family predicted phage head-tail adaptor
MARHIQVGALSERVTLQQLPTTQDAHGQESAAWVDFDEVWAKAEPLRGRDFFAAAQMQVSVSVRFTIRFRTDMPARLRVLWRGAAYDVQGEPIDIDARRIWLELMCQSGVRDAR